MSGVDRFYGVPAGTPASTCKVEGCGKRIYWITTPYGSRVPVDCDGEGGRRPSETNDRVQLDVFAGTAEVHNGRGKSHLRECRPTIGEQFPKLIIGTYDERGDAGAGGDPNEMPSLGRGAA